MKRKGLLLVGLCLPLAGLLALTLYKEFIVNTGKQFVLPVEGFDPRDLLSGHYITYRIKFAIPDLCTDAEQVQAVCLSGGGQHYATDDLTECDYPLPGECHGSRFETGLERFYIPQSDAAALDAAVRKGEGAIEVAVTPKGRSVVSALLIQGKRWESEK